MKFKPAVIALAAGAAFLGLSYFSSVQAAEQARQAQVIVNGTVASLQDGAFLDNGAYYLPVRELLEKLGYRVSWEEDAKRIVAEKKGSRSLELAPGQSQAVIGGSSHDLKLSVKLVEGIAFMPADPLLELLGYKVETDQYRGKLYLSASIWQKISDLLASGTGYRLEGGGSTGAFDNVSLYVDDELVYAGSWKDGAMDGGGKVYERGRLVYEGGLKANLPEGPGIRYDANGDRYEGIFATGVPQGNGRLFFGEKLYFEGNWKNGSMAGNGKLFDSDGKPVYEGAFENGVREGYGVLFNAATGKKSYEGNWKNDMRDGTGKSFDEAGKLVYSGSWSKDRKNGTGIAQRYGQVKSYTLDGTEVVSVEEIEVVYVTDVEYANGVLIKQAATDWAYRGDFTDTGEVNGQGEAGRITGTILSEAGVLHTWTTYYKGEFHYSRMTGKGVFYNNRGQAIYEGEVKDGKRNGAGVAYNASGELAYSGEWWEDQRHGKGFIYQFEASEDDVPGTDFVLTEVAYSRGTLTYSGNEYWVVGSAAGAAGYGKGTQRLIYDASKGTTVNWNAQSKTGGRLVYEGDFRNGLRDGAGVEFFADGAKYTGSFKNNVKSGTGQLANYNTRYEGDFLNDMKNGSGKLYQNGVLVYEGQFKDDKKNGQGISYLYAGSKEYEGGFKDDQRHGYGVLYDYWGNILYQGQFKEGQRQE